MAQIRAKITALGCYVPPRVLTNADLERLVETNDEWILTRTGISERHIADPEIATSDLATCAAKIAPWSDSIVACNSFTCATSVSNVCCATKSVAASDRDRSTCNCATVSAAWSFASCPFASSSFA